MAEASESWNKDPFWPWFSVRTDRDIELEYSWCEAVIREKQTRPQATVVNQISLLLAVICSTELSPRGWELHGAWSGGQSGFSKSVDRGAVLDANRYESLMFVKTIWLLDIPYFLSFLKILSNFSTARNYAE